MRGHFVAGVLVASLVPLGALAQGGAAPVSVSSAPSAAASAAVLVPSAVHEIQIQDYRYSPAVLTVPAGSTVRWVNLEKRVSHSILFAGAQGFESERIFPGETWQRRFDVPGRYEYSCGPHPEMKGRIDVHP